jgi:DNA-binding transcriptional MerR regulator
MRIGEVAKKAGASVRSIRHYEQAGLIRASRGSNGYRDFGADAVLTVRRIARMIRLGFGTAEIATFLNCIVDDPAEVTACESVAAAHREKLAEIERLIADLEARRKTLLATLRAASGPTQLLETPHAKPEAAPAPSARRLDPGGLLRRRG